MTKKQRDPNEAADPAALAQTLRQRAEAQTAVGAAQPPVRLSSEDTQQVLHELQVHQIELELQNEELRQTQAELEASRARYFDLYNLAPVGYVTLSEQGLILEANLTAAELLGVERSVLTRRPLTRFIAPEDQELYYQHRKRLLETGAAQACELRLLKREGAHFWARLETSAAQEAEGAPVCRAVISDITERRQAEARVSERTVELEASQRQLQSEMADRLQIDAALEKSEAKHRRLIERASDAIVLSDEQGNVIEWNPAAERIFGIPHAAAVGQKIWDVQFQVAAKEQKTAAVYQSLRAGLQEFLKSGKTPWPDRAIDTDVQAPDGSRRSVQSVVFPIATEQGFMAGSVTRDTTEQKRLEEALRRREREFSTLIENAPDMIVRFDIDLRHVYCNAAVERQLGVPAQVFVGKTPLELDPQSALAEFITQALRRVLETGAVQEVEQSVATPFGLKDVQTRIVPERDPQGRIESMLAITRDITARKRAEAALVAEQITRAQLVQTEKLAGMGRIMASVAHELNNPLQTIQNCLYLTKQGLPPNSPIHNYLEMATSEVRRLADLVEQLREVYRPRASGKMQSLNLSRLIQEVQTLMAAQLSNGQVVWTYTPRLAAMTVAGIGDQLKQVFINLSQNALDAMQPAGGTLAVAVALSADARQVGVAFRDTGPGIAPENIHRLFEPFFTTKFTGLGLGLAICHDIVQRHGGQLTVESQGGQGATFTVWLPLNGPEQ